VLRLLIGKSYVALRQYAVGTRSNLSAIASAPTSTGQLGTTRITAVNTPEVSTDVSNATQKAEWGRKADLCFALL
jgi:hypothetical protein